jgi:hypothetical protein
LTLPPVPPRQRPGNAAHHATIRRRTPAQTHLHISRGGIHGWVAVDLAQVDPDGPRELVTEAWLVTAPRRLTRQFER